MAVQSINDATNVGVGKPKTTGAVFIAPAKTTLPTDASSQLDTKFKGLGYMSEDGLTVSEERDTEDLAAWGGDIVYTSQTSYKETIAFTPIEINPEVMKAMYGDSNVEVGDGKLTVTHNAAELPELPLVIETVPNAKTVTRYVVPRAKLTEKGDLSLNGSDPMGRELTFTALPDENGNTMYEYHAITGIAAPEIEVSNE